MSNRRRGILSALALVVVLAAVTLAVRSRRDDNHIATADNTTTTSSSASTTTGRPATTTTSASTTTAVPVEGGPPSSDSTPTAAPVTAPPVPLASDAILYRRPDGLWAINPDGTGNTLIDSSTASSWTGVDWSPDHERLAYITPAPTAALHVRDLDGTDDRTITPADASGDLLAAAGSLRWSPDGSTIAFACYRPDAGYPHVCTVDPATGAARDLTPDFTLPIVAIHISSWSPDGRLLSYESRLVTIRYTGTVVLQVSDVSSGAHWDLGITNDGPPGSGSAITADGQSVLANTADGTDLFPINGGTPTHVASSLPAIFARSSIGDEFLTGNPEEPIRIVDLTGAVRPIPGTDGCWPAAW